MGHSKPIVEDLLKAYEDTIVNYYGSEKLAEFFMLPITIANKYPATDITVALKEEELQKTALKSAVDPEYISKLVDALVEEKLKQKRGK